MEVQRRDDKNSLEQVEVLACSVAYVEIPGELHRAQISWGSVFEFEPAAMKIQNML
jgi:hypothetical protein